MTTYLATIEIDEAKLRDEKGVEPEEKLEAIDYTDLIYRELGWAGDSGVYVQSVEVQTETPTLEQVQAQLAAYVKLVQPDVYPSIVIYDDYMQIKDLPGFSDERVSDLEQAEAVIRAAIDLIGSPS